MKKSEVSAWKEHPVITPSGIVDTDDQYLIF